ncbi:hypothetical protein ABBQ32_005726 [Trebouxia sp. C0010 RCD-2024]
MQMQQRPSVRNTRPAVVKIVNFKFMKKLGLKKPEFLPDFGKDKRQAVIDKFFTHHDKSTLESILADDAQVVEQGAKLRTYNKSEWINLMANHVVPAVPDFKWGHSTDGSKDEDGYSIVTVQVEPKHEKFKLQEATLKVKVEDQKIQEIVMEPARGAGFLAMYEALGGKVSVA